jgi:D-lactate dehydrogenase
MYHSSANQLQQLRVQHELNQATQGAQLALIDNSSCAGFAKQFDLPIMDVNQFLVERLVRSKLVHRYQRLALHIDCSTAKHCFNPEFMAILRLCAYEIVIPEGIKCCGFAGDKGFTIPELNASSLSGLATQVSECEIGVTFNRSCQIGLNQHSGIKYISFIELILDCLKV